VRRWLRKFGFPEPVFQYEVTLPDYGLARLDFTYPDLRVGVEADSFRWHSGRSAFERDRARISEFASLGWIVIQTTDREITRHPERVANRLRRARNQRL
jgi:very-short-patch-repair endonuclease